MTIPNALRPSAPACWLWPTALILAAGETWIDFAARPGINWLLSALAASITFVAFQRKARKPLQWQVLSPAFLACLLAGGAAITASAFLDALILMGVTGLLATSLLIATERGAEARLGAINLVLAPITAGWAVLREAGRRIREAAGYARAENSLPAMRGIALAAPITLGFALLLSHADPVLDSWRQAALIALKDLAFLSRTVCFVVFATIALGTLGTALASPADHSPVSGAPARTSLVLGMTERVIILSAVVSLFALFLILQLAHILGHEAATPGSGVTYAQAAHQGFGELTVAASLCATLLIGITRSANTGRLDAVERGLGLVLILQAQLLLLSAFHRITVYEQAYGFTELRLFVQCYALVVLVALALLGLEIWARPDFKRLAQRCAVSSALALIALVYWNYAAWIAHENIQRYERTGMLDVPYLVARLGPDAVPELTASLPRLPPDLQTRVRNCLRATYAKHPAAGNGRHAWYEWSYRRAALQSTLSREGLGADVENPSAATPNPCTEPH